MADGPGGAVLVACAHGTRDEAGRRAVEGLVAAVTSAVATAPRAVPGAPSAVAGGLVVEQVLAAYVDVQSPTPTEALAAVRSRPAVLVPLLLSSGYHVQVDLARAARTAAGPAVVAPALGPDDRLLPLLAEALDATGARDGAQDGADRCNASDTDVRLVAAGSSRARSGADVAEMARRLTDAVGVPVRPAYLSAAHPRLVDVVAANRAGGRRTVALSYLLAPGFFQRRLQESGAGVCTAPLLSAGEPPPAALVELVLARYAVASARLPA